MAAISSIPVSVILRTVWNDLGAIFVRLRSHSVIAFSIVVVLDIIGSVPGISSNPVLSEIFGLTSTIAVLPFEIAIFRLLILDDVAPGYDFAISTVRFQRMLGWTVGFWAFGNLPTYLPDILASSDAAKLIVSLAVLVTILVGSVVLIRMAILLPAIAVDAPGASFANAYADTRGHLWFILKALFAVLMPFMLIVILTAVLAWLGGGSDILGRSGAGGVAANAIFSALTFCATIAVTIVQARMFMRIGDRVKGGVEGVSD